MPYSKVDDLPDAVKKLSAEKQRQWMHVFNSAFDKCTADGGDDCDASAAKQAWSVVNKKESKSIREVRYTTTEVRIEDGNADVPAPHIVGCAARFNSWSEKIWGIFRETIRPGAFSKTLKEADIRALLNHDANYVLGRNKANTLELAEDGEGLQIRCTPPDTTWARDLVTSMRRGDINQMSFGFRSVKDEWNEAGDERTLNEVKLYDVSVVTFPAYPETSATIRNIGLMYGFDVNAVTGLLYRASRGVAFSDVDTQLLTASIEALEQLRQGATPTEPQVQEPLHSVAVGKPPATVVGHSLLARLRMVESTLKRRGVIK